jgi:hypothetical protein
MEHAPTNNADEEWRRAQAARAAFPWFGEVPSGEPPSPPELAVPDTAGDRPAAAGQSIREKSKRERRAATSETRPVGDIATDTRGDLVPRYQLLPCRADRLAAGDLVLEPHLGEVRIIWVATTGLSVGLVQLYWLDDGGINHAARTLPADRPVALRVPDLRDALTVQRGIDRSRYHRRQLDHHNARLIAAHLQGGPASPLYRLAVTGEIRPAALEELDWLATSPRRPLRRWSLALRSYCEARSDPGPLPELENLSW